MNQKQTVFLQALLTESTITKAAAKAGLARSTAYRYLKDDEFRAELLKKQDECISSTVRYLQGKLAMCSERLADIAADPETPAQVAINACNAIFTSCRTMTETEEIVNRLQHIEEAMKENEWR